MAVADEVVAARSKSLQKSHFSGLVRDVLIDLEELATTKYSGGYFFEEMQGMADATGIDFKVLT